MKRLHAVRPDAVLGITTNGTMLARLAPSLAAAGVTRVNISLDTLDSARFRSVTKAKLEKVLSGVEAAQEAGFPHLKLNAVLQRTINGDQLPRLVRYAENAGTELRFIELMPVGCAAHLYKEEHLSAADALMKLRRSFPYLKDLGITGTAQRHLLQVGGRDFAIGFIAPVSHPFCGTCNRLRLDAYGRLSPCLRSTKSYDLATASDVRVARVLAGAEQGHRQQATAWPDRRMVSIGG